MTGSYKTEDSTVSLEPNKQEVKEMLDEPRAGSPLDSLSEHPCF